jgi:threonine/homoserine/homoserine lactone efflux protein
MFLVPQGISLGFSAGAMPGPLQSYLISTTLASGWRRSIILVLSPLITDVPIIILMVFILKQFPPALVSIIQIVGGLYLLWLTYRAWKQFRGGVTFPVQAEPPKRTLAQGLLVNWLSPGPYIFWGTINGPLLLAGLAESIWAAAAFLVAFYGTFLGMLALYVLVFDRLRQLNPRVTSAIFLVTIVVLGLFGLSLVAQGLHLFGV